MHCWETVLRNHLETTDGLLAYVCEQPQSSSCRMFEYMMRSPASPKCFGVVVQQVREAVEAQEPKFSASRQKSDTDYFVIRDLPAVSGIDPEGTGSPLHLVLVSVDWLWLM